MGAQDGEAVCNVLADGDIKLQIDGAAEGSASGFDGQAEDTEIIIDGAASLEMGGSAECGIVTRVRISDYPDYHGQTTVTPGEEEVVLSTEEEVVHDNIVVRAIPSNYGRIAWNGNSLRVY